MAQSSHYVNLKKERVLTVLLLTADVLWVYVCFVFLAGQCVKSIYTFNAVTSLCFIPERQGFIVTGSGRQMLTHHSEGVCERVLLCWPCLASVRRYQMCLGLRFIDLALDAGKLQVWSWSSQESCQSVNAHLDSVTTLQVGERHGNRTALASGTFSVCPLDQHMLRKEAEVLPEERSLKSARTLRAIFKHGSKVHTDAQASKGQHFYSCSLRVFFSKWLIGVYGVYCTFNSI